MRKVIAVCLFALLVSFTTMAQDEPKVPAGKGSLKATSGAKPDKILMQEIWNAWGTLDVNNAAKFYAKDGPFPFYDITPLKYSTWQEYENGVKPVLAGFQSARITVNDDAVIRTRGDGALGTATVHMDYVEKDGNKGAMDLRWTVVWEKEGANWLIVHEQISAPLNMEKK